MNGPGGATGFWGRRPSRLASLAYVPGIHAFLIAKAWMAGTSPAMTDIIANMR